MFQGKFEEAWRVVKSFEKSGRTDKVGEALNEISTYYLCQGELDQALKYGLKSLATLEGIGHKVGVANAKDTVGFIYYMKGELDFAEDYFHQSMREFNSLGKPFGRVYPPAHLADVYQAKGDFIRAIEYANQALILCEEEEFYALASQVLYRLVSLTLDIQEIEDAKDYFQRLQILSLTKIKTHEYKKYVNQLCRLAEGHILKYSPRLRDKMKAQEIFKEIAEERMVFFPNTFDAMISLCELLLIELSVSEEETILHDVKNLVNKLIELSRQQQSHSSVVNALIIQTKFAMIEGDLTKAFEFLEQAEVIAKEKKLNQLVDRVVEEKKLIQDQFNEWETLVQSNASFQIRIKQAQVDEYLLEALKLVKMNQRAPGP